mmetsp:Transcript_2754/g.5703  ORF Transcript_2754/g.5703 Transcript_2754/m.5703 type:complete len:225 (+) Transcript_2754:280-954(+)
MQRTSPGAGESGDAGAPADDQKPEGEVGGQGEEEVEAGEGHEAHEAREGLGETVREGVPEAPPEQRPLPLERVPAETGPLPQREGGRLQHDRQQHQQHRHGEERVQRAGEPAHGVEGAVAGGVDGHAGAAVARGPAGDAGGAVGRRPRPQDPQEEAKGARGEAKGEVCGAEPGEAEGVQGRDGFHHPEGLVLPTAKPPSHQQQQHEEEIGQHRSTSVALPGRHR